MQEYEFSKEFLTTLHFVQNIIARMATMCTICKICATTAFSAFVMAATKENSGIIFGLAALILIVLAWIDGRYLFRERNYIDHYKELVEKWNQQTLQKEDLFKITIGSLKKHPKNTKCSPLLSSSIFPFYGILLVCDGLFCLIMKS